jgi:hypothetical protein
MVALIIRTNIPRSEALTPALLFRVVQGLSLRDHSRRNPVQVSQRRWLKSDRSCIHKYSVLRFYDNEY